MASVPPFAEVLARSNSEVGKAGHSAVTDARPKADHFGRNPRPAIVEAEHDGARFRHLHMGRQAGRPSARAEETNRRLLTVANVVDVGKQHDAKINVAAFDDVKTHI